MEDFGVGGAVRMGALLFQQASRRSGRTSRLVERVGALDWIIVATAAESRRLKNLLREAGKADVTVHVIPPADIDRAWHLGTNPRGDTHFETSWVEGWYLNHIEVAQKQLATLQGALSKNRREPHRKDDWSYRFRAEPDR